MSSDTHDRMRRYETDHDSGDANTNATNDPQPAVSPAPVHLGNDASDNPDPIPMATPQSPVQTEDSPEAGDDNSPEVGSNRGSDKEYREV